MLELAKGKLTTDPVRHSGEGILFCSRMFDRFQYGDDLLISRSQAKRLLARVDRFRTVLFDFDGVSAIGQAFADEIFRVFRLQHPDMELYAINASVDVQDMVNRAINANVTSP